MPGEFIPHHVFELSKHQMFAIESYRRALPNMPENKIKGFLLASIQMAMQKENVMQHLMCKVAQAEALSMSTKKEFVERGKLS